MNHHQYLVDLNILCGAERLILAEGKGKGMSLIRMFNGVFNLMVSVDRCLDIYRADYRGKNIAFISKNGMVNANLSSLELRFVHTFGGGLLYTCGLDNIGAPRDGFTQHGSISYIPAENVHIIYGTEYEKHYVEVSGDMKHTALFGSHLILRRSIRLYDNEPKIHIKDDIINQNDRIDQYMLLYHFNLGYPFINEHTTLQISDVLETLIHQYESNRKYTDFRRLEKPNTHQNEEVFIHKMAMKKAQILVDNTKEMASLTYETTRLSHLVQWKSMIKGDYALGIEPATTDLGNRQYTEIEPFDHHEFKLEFGIIEHHHKKGEENE